MNEKPSPWVERFLPLITAGGSVLDLACGNGRHSLLLASTDTASRRSIATPPPWPASPPGNPA
jgi:hypothetical protein